MIGERIRHAREFCALTQTALAELTGLTQKKVSEIEAGRDAHPRTEDIESIARATGFPASFFYLGALPDMPTGNFRRLKRGTAQVARQVRAQARQVVELVQRAETALPLPPIRLRPVRHLEDFERLADEVRDQAGIGEGDPIPNLTRAVERAGVIVATLPGEIPDHSGFSAWPDFALEGRPVIVLSAMLPGDRQRFTVAHEVGHLLLHSQLRDDELDINAAEKEAHRFAGALLLPYGAALEALKPPLTLTTLAHVKATFGISIGACVQRAYDLDLITEARYVSLRKQLTSRGWHRSEPVVVPQEQPLLIRRILKELEQGETMGARAASVQMPIFAYRSLAAAN